MKYLTPEFIQGLIEFNVANRERFDDHKHLMPIPTYLKELGTVALSVGRQTGHTTAICKLARPWDLVITESARMADELKYRMHELAYRNIQVRSISSAISGYNRGRSETFKTIFVDCASYISKDKLDELYMMYGHHHEQTFVLLG